MTNEATAYNAINIGLSESNSPQTTNNTSIVAGIDEGIEQSYAERAEHIRREEGLPPKVIGPKEKTKEGFYPPNEWDSVPSVKDTYSERKKKLFEGGWNDQDQFLKLYHGKFSETPYDKREGESLLARRFSFAFGKNVDFVAFHMENLRFPTDYEIDPWHRRSVLDFAIEEVDSIYCEGIDLDTKFVVALHMSDWQEATVPLLSEELNFGVDQLRNTLNVLEAEGLVEKVQRENRREADVWIDRGITEDYLSRLLEHKKRLEEQE